MTVILGGGGDSSPVGAISLWASTATSYPDGWIPLDGSVTDLTPYPELDRLFPSGLPDFSGRVPRGTTAAASNAGTDFNSGISKKLETSNVPTHQHRGGDHVHGYTLSYNSTSGATSIAGSSGPANSSFPTQTAAGGAGVWGYQEVAKNGTVVVNGSNGGQTAFDYTNPAELVVYIMKAG